MNDEDKTFLFAVGFGLIGLCVVAIILPVINSNAEDYNPFDYIRETEEQQVIEGTIIHVEYIDWETCKVVMNNSRTYTFHGSDYGRLKTYEDESVRIICFTQGWDGKYRTYPCNDREHFEIKEYGIFPLPLE